MGWGSANLPLLLLLLPLPLVLLSGEWGMRFPVWFLLVLTGKEEDGMECSFQFVLVLQPAPRWLSVLATWSQTHHRGLCFVVIAFLIVWLEFLRRPPSSFPLIHLLFVFFPFQLIELFFFCTR